ncbi:MAG TPA: hypothetical protein VFN44_16020 [Solirubrobacteraceae bacterium]|nr:hypothetical protein [Solirubrobacteraceae bacterium]
MSPTATTTRVVVERRFNGPPASANGGYACGLVARHVDGPAQVSLRRPVPLDVPLELERHDDGHVTLHDGEVLIAEGDPALPLDIEPPYRPTVGEAREAARLRPGAWPETFDSCWVCAAGRRDGLGVVFGPLPSRPEMTGAVLFARAGVPQDEGVLAPEIVWAALDCPSYTPPLWGHARPSLLASLHAELLAPVPAGVPLAVVGWSLGGEGRKHRSATAVLDADGEVLARAEALWIRLRA